LARFEPRPAIVVVVTVKSLDGESIDSFGRDFQKPAVR
jgi:hypothetical protein